MEIFKTIVLLRWTSPLPSRQEFLTLRPAVSMSSQPLARDLQWMVNFEIEGAWQYVPVKRVVRGLIPRDMYVAGFSFCWQITSSEGESLIRSAVREGTWIALNHLRLVCNKLGVDPPEPKKGSGKDGAVVKIDWARKLVDFLFPDSSVEEKKG